MRLELLGATELSSFRRAMALTKAEYVLASRGVLLSECVEAIAADARKELPHPIHWAAFVDAEHAALEAALGDATRAPSDVVLGVVLHENDFEDGVVPSLIAAGAARLSPGSGRLS